MYVGTHNAGIADAGVIVQSAVDGSQFHIALHGPKGILTPCRIEYPL
jgi:hypothetical protein